MREIAFAIAGLLFGSFLTVVVHRVPRRQSIVAPRSRCPRCGGELRARDNIPILSYLLLRGRCRSCGEPVSLEYPLTEAATAVLFAAVSFAIGPLLPAILVAVFVGVMLAVALIDARWRIVPNRIVYPSLVLYGIAILAGDLAGGGVDIIRGLIGMAAYGGILLVIALIVPRGMGMGDVKLAALIGLVLGALGLGYVGVAAFLGVVAGGVGGLVAMAALGYGRKQQMPFGPFLAGGAVVAALAAPPIVRAYLSLFGVA
ncbi:MAG TPA: prepilin peptidase [Actinomycetota bacterium]|nr:prepilin peptidase [Actinomycetota bacterium]